MFVQPGRKESNLHTTASKAAGLPLADTRVSFAKKSAMSESNRPHRIGSPGPLPLGQWHIGKSSGSRNRTCVWAINSRLPVPTQDPPEYVSTQSGWSDLNRRSRAPEARGVARLSHTPKNEERPARIELAIPPWQGDGLPLHHGRFLLAQPNCQRSRAPSENRTHATALRKRRHSTRPSVLIHSVGSAGIEPTSTGLRVRCITLSATIPFCFLSSRVGVEGIEPSACVL